MNPTDLIKLARDMRQAQKAYFRTRTTSALKKARHLESVFDREAEQFLNPSKQLCFENLNSLPLGIFDQPFEPLQQE